MSYILIYEGKENPIKFKADSVEELFIFLLEYNIEFDVVKKVNELYNLNNLSLN